MNGSFVGGRSPLFGELGAIRQSRGWFVALGAALIILGVLAMAVPFAATLVSTIFLGWILILGGIAEGVHAVRARAWQSFPWAVLSAALGVAAGILLIVFPLVGTLTLTLVLAGYFTAQGILKIVRAAQHRGMERWGFLLFDGLVTLGLGILIWAQWPAASVWVIGLLVGIDLLVGGVSMLVLAVAAGQLTRTAAV
jgi:uncharacterized membrane protein HdeD (DUF308 family)